MANSLQLLTAMMFAPTLTTSSLGSFSPSINLQTTLLPGTSNDQVDLVYIKEHTIAAAGSPLDLDLNGGGLTDPSGATLAFAKVVTICVANLTTNAGELVIIGGGSNPLIGWIGAAGDLNKIGIGGRFYIHSPGADAYVVTAGSADNLRISISSGTNVPIAVGIAGRSA